MPLEGGDDTEYLIFATDKDGLLVVSYLLGLGIMP